MQKFSAVYHFFSADWHHDDGSASGKQPHVRYFVGILAGPLTTLSLTPLSLLTHTNIHTNIQTYIHTYIHTYLHTYIHTYIHTYNICAARTARSFAHRSSRVALVNASALASRGESLARACGPRGPLRHQSAKVTSARCPLGCPEAHVGATL